MWPRIKATVFALTFVFILAAGCQRESKEFQEASNVHKGTEEKPARDIAESFRDIYERAKAEDRLDHLDTKRAIVECLGRSGHVAVDMENQINMTRADKMQKFIEAAKFKEKADITVLCVEDEGSFTQYRLETEKGEIWVERKWIAWEKGKPQVKYEEEYRAAPWSYSDKGYLFFKKYQPEGYHGPMPYTYFRVQALDDRYREMNRKYILPIGYGENNLFFLDWNKNDYGKVDFDDLFRKLYRQVYGEDIPYTMSSETWGIGKRYRISGEEYEKVLRSFFEISSEELRQRGTYFSQDDTYEFRPRACYDMEMPEEAAYPEIIECRENGDGTKTLTVNAIYPAESSAEVLTHEVTVCDKENGGFEYISNKVLYENKELINSWHRDRLTRERWEEMFPEVEEG